MNKNFIYLILSSLLIIFSCDDIPDGVIEPSKSNFEVVGVEAPNLLVNSPGNQLEVTVLISNSESIEKIWFDVLNIDASESITEEVDMIASGNSDIVQYNGSVGLDENLLTSKYQIVIYAKDNVNPDGENVSKIAVKVFEYQSEAENFPPMINDLSLPSEVNKGIQFKFSMLVSDQNGLSDIDSVYYQLKNPDGTQVTNSQGISKFPMFDDGNTSSNGDASAGDGYFTVQLTFPISTISGEWEFSFTASDKSGEVSDTIVQSLKVK